MIRCCGSWARMISLGIIVIRAVLLAMSCMPMTVTLAIPARMRNTAMKEKASVKTQPFQKLNRVIRYSTPLVMQSRPVSAWFVICTSQICLWIPTWVTPCGITNLMPRLCGQKNRSTRLKKKSTMFINITRKVLPHVVNGAIVNFWKMCRI